jgi:hypothetical protein
MVSIVSHNCYEFPSMVKNCTNYYYYDLVGLDLLKSWINVDS